MTSSVLLPQHFTPPLQNPSPNGLYAVTDWQVPSEEGSSSEGAAHRHLNGVEVRPVGNYGGDGQSGVWAGHYCDDPVPGQKKEGLRLSGEDPFDPITVWAYDECDLTEPSRREVATRAAQILRMQEQIDVEREFAGRMLVDAGPHHFVGTFRQAITYLEGVLAITNTLGFIHLGAQWASEEFGLVIKSGTRMVSPMGHTFVFGGGYVDALGYKFVATSPTFGWRDEATVRTAIDERNNTFSAVAERTVVIGYEAILAVAEID